MQNVPQEVPRVPTAEETAAEVERIRREAQEQGEMAAQRAQLLRMPQGAVVDATAASRRLSQHQDAWNAVPSPILPSTSGVALEAAERL